MKRRTPLSTSLRDCTAGWIGATFTFLVASSWQTSFSTVLPGLFITSLLIAGVILLFAFPLSVFCRSHLPSDSANGNSMIFGLTGILLSQVIMISSLTLPVALFGRNMPSIGDIYSATLAPLLWTAAAAGGIIGHMAGIPDRKEASFSSPLPRNSCR